MHLAACQYLFTACMSCPSQKRHRQAASFAGSAAPGLTHEKRPEHSPAFQGSINFCAESMRRSARVRSTGCAEGPLPF